MDIAISWRLEYYREGARDNEAPDPGCGYSHWSDVRYWDQVKAEGGSAFMHDALMEMAAQDMCEAGTADVLALNNNFNA